MWGSQSQARCPDLSPSVPCLQFFLGEGQAHPTIGATSLGVQPSVGSRQTCQVPVRGKGLIRLRLSRSTSSAGLLQVPVSVMDASLHCCFIQIAVSMFDRCL